MSNMKGLSQILYLIIAASVLMIAALSLVFMLDEGMSGIIEFGGDADVQGCHSAVEAACASGASTVSTPPPCLTTDADGNEEIVAGIDSSIGTDDVACNEFDG